jgi:small GTP-binding protein
MSRVSQPPAFKLLRTLRGHQDVIHRMAWSPNLRWLATPARDGTVRVWDFHTGVLQATLEHDSWVNAVAWSPDGRHLVSGSERGTIALWGSQDWSLDRAVRAHAGRIECLAWRPGGDSVASASSDATIGIWDPTTGVERHRIDAHSKWANAVAWSPDGRVLATGAEDLTVRLWDGSSYEPLCTLRDHTDWVTDVAWAPDGSVVASCADRAVRLWDPATGALLQILRAHEGRVKCASFSSDGRMLASKGEDSAVRVWRCDTWEEVVMLEEPTLQEANPESTVAFHPSLPVLATLGEVDTVVRLWSIDCDRLMGAAAATPGVSYRSAKVVLVGASNTGKTCLARALMGFPFVPQESTHGMKVWSMSTETVVDESREPVQQEMFLWDLAGQSDYQLVHQLFLDQTSSAIVLFDPTDAGESLSVVRHWIAALSRAAGAECPRLLVGGRVDRGAAHLSGDEIQGILDNLGFAQYIATSAKTGHGVSTLRGLMEASVRWHDLPITRSPRLWQDAKSYILERRQHDTLIRASDLKVGFGLSHSDQVLSDRAFDTVLAHLQTQGLVWRLSFGDLLLLKPELLNDYASAVVLAARNHPQGLGCVVERDVLDARIDLSAVDRIQVPESESLLLHAVVQRFLERDIALREGVDLVLPSKLRAHDVACEGIGVVM